MNYQIISITTIDSGYAGKLSFFEASRDVPFEIKRIYYIHGVPNEARRGGHAVTVRPDHAGYLQISDDGTLQVREEF